MVRRAARTDSRSSRDCPRPDCAAAPSGAGTRRRRPAVSSGRSGLHLVGAAAEGDENRLPATIVERSFEGSFFQLAARAGDLPVAVQLPNAEGTPDLAAGATVTFGFGPADAVVLADRG